MVCEWCLAEFETKPATASYGEGRFCSRHCHGCFTAHRRTKRTSKLESLVAELLGAIGHRYEQHARVGRWGVDFFLPDFNLVIECDGVYWHSLPGVSERDARKTAELRAGGYRVVRLGEKALMADAAGAVQEALTA